MDEVSLGEREWVAGETNHLVQRHRNEHVSLQVCETRERVGQKDLCGVCETVCIEWTGEFK